MSSTRPTSSRSLTERVQKSITLDRAELAAIKSAFDVIVLRNLRYVSFWLSLLYVIFLFDHLAFSPAPGAIMMYVDIATSLILIAVARTISKGRVAENRSHLLSGAVALIILATDVLDYVISQQPLTSVNMILVEIGVASFILSLEWFIGISLVITTAWLIPTIAIPEFRSNLALFGIIFITSLVLASLIQVSRIRTLAELELSYLRFRRLSDAAMEGIVIHKNGVILDVNQNFSRLFGYERSELVGKELESLFFNGDIGIRKNGTSFPIERSSQVIVRGAEPILAEAIQDISKRREAEKTIVDQRMKIIYSAKMSALGEMAAGISHEIKNPLTAIMLRAELFREMIKNDKLDREKALKLLSELHSDGERINKIIVGLGTFARDADKNQFELASLKRIIEESLPLTIERSKRQGIRIQLDPIPENLLIECRPTQISQVLLNLLGNAFDAVESVQNKWVKISFRDLGNQAEIAVTDSGTGIPPEIRDKIMQPFFTTKSPKRGTGLGLSISAKLIERHQGVLELDPTSKHTRFLVRLPKRQPQEVNKSA